MIEFVTDRTKSDALLGTPKGCYGVEDLNRVESAVEEIIRLVLEHYGTEISLDIRPWSILDGFNPYAWPAESNMARYLTNVIELRAMFGVYCPDFPDTMSNLTWEGANAIEKTLKEIYLHIQTVLEKSKNITRYSGEFYAGEETTV